MQITKDEETAYRLCHHNFAGLTIQAAANVMDTSVKEIRLLLKTLENKAPQLFPILGRRQAEIWGLYESGWSETSIAEKLELSDSTVRDTIMKVRKKLNISVVRHKPKVLSLTKEMESHIVRKF